MSETDTPYIIMMFAVIIVIGLLFAYVIPVFLDNIGDKLPAGAKDKIQDKTDQVVGFLDLSFVALFLIFAAASIALTVVLASHPVGLAVWLFMCFISLIVWDAAADFVDTIAASILNTGDMSTAINFFTGDMPKAVVVINILMGMVIFARGGRLL